MFIYFIVAFILACVNIALEHILSLSPALSLLLPLAILIDDFRAII